jgi:hypothetical protein
MRFEKYDFGSIRVDGFRYEYDVVIDHGFVHRRKKNRSKVLCDSSLSTPPAADRRQSRAHVLRG